MLTVHEIALDYHTNSLLKRSYLFGDVLRQLIPIPRFSSVSERVQSAEQQIRWDGRITNQQRSLLFSNIERLALQGSGMSQINAMQSLAKIVHSLSIKDFRRLQDAGYPQETLLQILRIKAQALRGLKMLSNRTHVYVQSEEAQQVPAATLRRPLVSTLYATYLLWWLGMGKFKHSPLFWSFKLGKLALEGLFLKGLIESILDVINCPDKKGFRMFFGDFELWANDLTLDCFNEFVRQFRLIYKKEPLKPFLEQLSNFDLRAAESIDLSDKALTLNETIEILSVLYQAAPVKTLNLALNKINDTTGLWFPDSLQSLDLSYNYEIADEGAKELRLPPMLQFLNLSFNKIGDEGAKGIQLPSMLQSLFLYANSIGDEGAKGLQLPLSLQNLDLRWNNIGAEGIKGLQLQLPSALQSLDLARNKIGDEWVKELQLPSSLTALGLGGNISAEGLKRLQLSSLLTDLRLSFHNLGAEEVKELQFSSLTSLKSLDLTESCIGAAGAKELELPATLQRLYLSGNNLGDEGAKWLRLPSSLEYLNLEYNNISNEGTKWLRLPPTLRLLFLAGNNIGDEGAKGLQPLPPSLQFLHLADNNISDGGVRGLQPFPPLLQFLHLGGNNIGDEGSKELQLPSMLQSLNLSYNNISDKGINELLKKIPGTKLMLIGLNGNPYNSTAINVNRDNQQKRLLKNCHSQLCYASTLLSQQDEYQTSSAAKAAPSLFFSWLKKPFDKLSEYANDRISETLGSLGARLQKIVRQSPSYFPNIHSSEINDWQPPGTLVLHQFKSGASNTLLLSATQPSVHLPLRFIAR